MSDQTIKVYQDAIDEVDRQMKTLSIPDHSILNSDSPYRSLIELRGQRIKELTETRMIINDAKRSILSRKLSIFRDIVYLFGEK